MLYARSKIDVTAGRPWNLKLLEIYVHISGKYINFITRTSHFISQYNGIVMRLILMDSLQENRI